MCKTKHVTCDWQHLGDLEALTHIYVLEYTISLLIFWRETKLTVRRHKYHVYPFDQGNTFTNNCICDKCITYNIKSDTIYVSTWELSHIWLSSGIYSCYSTFATSQHYLMKFQPVIVLKGSTHLFHLQRTFSFLNA